MTRVRDAARRCESAVSGQSPGSPADVLTGLARACDELGIDAWDTYGDGGAVRRLEDDLVERFGVEAAAFFPSGVMAQQTALRVHCDRAGSRRVAMPDLSHLLVHEEDGPRVLHDLEVLFLTRGFEVPTAAHVAALPGRLGAVLVELPLRDAGCLLPTWDELRELSGACRERGGRCTSTARGSGRRSRGSTTPSPRSPPRRTRRTSRSTRASAGWPGRRCSGRRTSSPRPGGGAAGWAGRRTASPRRPWPRSSACLPGGPPGSRGGSRPRWW